MLMKRPSTSASAFSSMPDAHTLLVFTISTIRSFRKLLLSERTTSASSGSASAPSAPLIATVAALLASASKRDSLGPGWYNHERVLSTSAPSASSLPSVGGTS